MGRVVVDAVLLLISRKLLLESPDTPYVNVTLPPLTLVPLKANAEHVGAVYEDCVTHCTDFNVVVDVVFVNK
jgi:hypothetical protein